MTKIIGHGGCDKKTVGNYEAGLSWHSRRTLIKKVENM